MTGICMEKENLNIFCTCSTTSHLDPPPPPPLICSAGPETVDSLVSGPQSMKSIVSSAANSEKNPISPSLAGFLLPSTPKSGTQGSPKNGSAFPAAHGTAATSSPPLVSGEQPPKEASASNAADAVDVGDALCGALAAQRTPGPPMSVGHNEKIMGAALQSRNNGSAGRGTGPGGRGGGRGGGVVRGGRQVPFLERIRAELVAVLKNVGGSCTMANVSYAYERTFQRQMNLEGNKVNCVVIVRYTKHALGGASIYVW